MSDTNTRTETAVSSSLLMAALLAPVEAMLNVWLRHDQHALAALNRSVGGRVVTVACTSTPRWQLNILVTPQRVLLRATDDDPSDATLRGTRAALTRLLFADDPAAALHHPDLHMTGDIHLVQDLHSTISRLDVDWEDILAPWVTPVTGDSALHVAANALRSGQRQVGQGLHAMRLNTTDYLQEELAILPSQTEVALFVDDLDTLRLRVDRLAARIALLKNAAVTN